jgi:hypothetical protein
MHYFSLSRAKHVILFMLLVIGMHAIAFAQSIPVKGRVTNEKSEPVSNISVLLKGSKSGVTTDNNGNFSITVPNSR